MSVETLKQKVTSLIDLAGIYAMIQQGLYNYGNGVASVQQLFAICVWDKVPLFDYINVTDLTKLCYRNISITRIEFKNTHNVTKFSNTFYGCTSLTDIIGIDLSRVSTVTAMFTSCTALENLVIVGEIPKTLDIKYSPLSVESAKNVLLALKNYAGTEYEYKYNISFSSEVWDRLNSDGNTAPGGISWADYVWNKAWNK